MKRFLAFLLIAAIAAAGAWFAARNTATKPSAAKTENKSGPKVLYYQSSMHPWIKSEKPGNCTICGMKLSPVYEGEKGYEMEQGMVHLSSNSITVLNVASAPVKKEPLHRTLRLAGIIDDDDSKHRFISAFIPGRIESLSVAFVGAEVQAGAPLATIFSPELLTAEREYASLAAKGGGELVELAALRLRRMGLTDAQIKELPRKDPSIAESEIVAPAAGTVVNRFVYPGQYVMEGEKLFEVADFSKMWLQLNVYERDLAWVRVGQVVRVQAPSLPGKVFEGKIAFINPNIDEMTRSAIARVELENPLVEENGVKRRILYHKLYAEASIAIETEPVLSIARSAVLNPGGKPSVYVDLGSGGYEKREIKLGRRGDEAWEILEGLDEEENVVIEGNLLIDSQAEVEKSRHSGGAHDHSAPAKPTAPAEHKHDAAPEGKTP